VKLVDKKTLFTYPTERYLNVIKCGYKDCNLDGKYLKKALVSIWFISVLDFKICLIKKLIFFC